MPTVKLPINAGLNKAIDEIGLKGYGAALQDCIVDELGNIHRRPGLTLLCDLGTAAKIDGLYWWDEQEWAVAVSGGETHKITDSSGTNAQIAGDTFGTGTRVVFDNYGTDLYAANGAKILQIPNSGNVTAMADGDAPTTVTHPVILDTYLLANQTSTGKSHYSDVGAPTSWSANFVTAEAKTDILQAQIAANLSLYLLGKFTLEIWRNDGSTPFVRELQGYIDSGTIAPYSFTLGGGSLYWLDQERNVVVLPGGTRTPIALSVPMNNYIQGFSTVTDAIGDYIVVGGRPYFVLSFPTEEKTLVWDVINKRFYEWGYWDSSGAVYENWLGNAYCLSPTWNVALVGDKNTGKIYTLDTDSYDDNGDTLRTLIRTSHIDHNTQKYKKRSHSLTFQVKRSNVASEASVTSMTMRWRDNGKSSWSNERTVSLAQVGDTEFRGQLRRMGSYYSRQYEFVVSDDTPLVLVAVEENFDFMRN